MELKLSAQTRQNKGEKDREAGHLPAVVYGANLETLSLNLEYGTFTKFLEQAGYSNLIDLAIDDKDAGKILIHQVQYNPVTDNIMHVDLKRIEMNKELEATIKLNFISESPAVKEKGGTLVTNIDEILVRCLPKDLVSDIEVDLSVLKTFEDIIRVKDINLPAGLVLVDINEETAVAKAIAALTEEQIKAMEEKGTDVGEVEVLGEKKEEGEEGKDGKEVEGEKKETEKTDKKADAKPEDGKK